MPRHVAERLRRGQAVDDADFDALYPEWGRWLSRMHWTPLKVARRAAELLVVRPGARVLDVGSGLGKLVIAGSLATGAVFHGVEQREHFVEAARDLAARMGARGARFEHGNMTALDWSRFDAFYLYNPFLENLRSLEPLDESVDVKPEIYAAYVRFVTEALAPAASGTRVVTYHGFGGELPAGFKLEQSVRAGNDYLKLWIKGAA